MIGRIRTGLALLLVAGVTIPLGPVQWLAIRTGFPRPSLVPRLWHRVASRALGMRVRVTGRIAADRPLLLVSNHVSWIDIVAIGAAADVSFIAKSEMAGWPVAGWLARMQRTVFVERERRRKSGEQANEIGSRLLDGDVMVLFAEGTTGDGNAVLPFKSTLFGAAKMALTGGASERVFIQPMAIAYTRFHGMPMQRIHMPMAAWIGDADLMPHAGALLKEGAIDVELRFGEPFAFDAVSDRKAVAALAEAEVRRLHAEALRNPA